MDSKAKNCYIICFLILFSANIFCSCFKDESKQYIFIGDSLLSNYDTEKYFPSLYVKNKGVPGYKIQDCLNLHLDCRGYIAVLLVGTNNLRSNFDNNFINTFVEDYTELVDGLHADKVIVISLLPRKGYNNAKINFLNDFLRDSLSVKNNVIFLDIFDDFLKDDTLNPEYTTDGLHLNYMGYILLTNRLNKVL